MNSPIETLFPLAAGIILLLVIIAALLAAPIAVGFILTGTLFFIGGLIFGRRTPSLPWGAGLSLLGPFLATSAFLVMTFGVRLLVFPLLAVCGTASGLSLRRMFPGGSRVYLLGAAWLIIVVAAGLLVVPGLFDRLNPH